nr:hypothetical protein GCM10020092_024010 [Actinoplanes digitatis]
MTGARLVARRASRPASLIAARRLADNPWAGFRSVSGLVLALFVTSVAVGVMGTITADRYTPTEAPDTAALITLFRDDDLAPTGDPAPAGLVAQPGVRAVVLTRIPPEGLPIPEEEIGDWGWPHNLVSCADVARAGAGRCADGAQVAWTWLDLASPPGWSGTWPTADVEPAALAAYPVQSILTFTDGSTAAVEQARTTLQKAHPMLYSPYSEAEWRAESEKVFHGWQRLANVVILTSLAIAGCSLAVSVAGGLSDRKRPFSMLRLTGVPLGMLRRVVALEARHAAAGRGRGRGGIRAAGGAPVPDRADGAGADATRDLVLCHRDRRDRVVARRRRLHHAAAAPDHRTGGGPQRMRMPWTTIGSGRRCSAGNARQCARSSTTTGRRWR